MILPMKRVLITGGSSCLGVRLARKLHEQGVEVILYDDRPPLAILEKGITWAQGELLEYDTMEKALTDFGQVSAVFHLSPFTSICCGRPTASCSKRTQNAYADSVQGTQVLIQACLAASVPCLVLTSPADILTSSTSHQTSKRRIASGFEKRFPLVNFKNPGKSKALHPGCCIAALTEWAVLAANGTQMDGTAWQTGYTYDLWVREHPERHPEMLSAAEQLAASNLPLKDRDKKAGDLRIALGAAAAAEEGVPDDAAPSTSQDQDAAADAPAWGRGDQDGSQRPLAREGSEGMSEGAQMLRTCVVRPAAVYGLPGCLDLSSWWLHGGQQHQQQQRPAGKEQTTTGGSSGQKGPAGVELVHVDNLLEAQVRAGSGLTAAMGYVAAGQVYHISDGQEVPYAEVQAAAMAHCMPGPPEGALGTPGNPFVQGTRAAAAAALWLLSRAAPGSARAVLPEVALVHVDKGRSIDKAREQLGYAPTKQDVGGLWELTREGEDGFELVGRSRDTQNHCPHCMGYDV